MFSFGVFLKQYWRSFQIGNFMCTFYCTVNQAKIYTISNEFWNNGDLISPSFSLVITVSLMVFKPLRGGGERKYKDFNKTQSWTNVALTTYTQFCTQYQAVYRSLKATHRWKFKTLWCVFIVPHPLLGKLSCLNLPKIPWFPTPTLMLFTYFRI